MKTFYKLTLLFTVFIIIALVAAMVAFNIFTSTSTIPVPNLSGKSLMDATITLSEKRLYLKIGGEDYSTDVPAGFIMKQDIPSDNKIKEGRTLSVIMSKGPYIKYMPDFTGIFLTEAEAVAAKNNIKNYRIVTVHSDKVERNKVIAQIPAPEEKGSKDLSLLVSAGGYETTYYCPDFAGRPLSEAQELAKSIGLELVINGSGGKIIDQQPQAHSIIRKFSKVTITLEDSKEEKKDELEGPKEDIH
jgi:serine/threonine-protein kinase